MRLELTIKADYRPAWGSDEGIRELLQNAKDAQTEFNAEMTVTYRKDVMRIENTGVVLDHEALLLGHSTKAERSDLIGQWGEGLKLGVLALVRAGHQVKIRSGAEVWAPEIIRSKNFNADVLAFNITGGRKPRNRVCVEIDGITESMRDSIRHRFLWLHPPQPEKQVKTTNGTLLLGSECCGCCYVKGILVEHDEKLNFGYDFVHASTDSDRKMVNSYDKKWYCARILGDAVKSRPDLLDAFFALLDSGAEDTRSLDATSAQYVPPSVAEDVAEKFISIHGKDAVPVSDFAGTVKLDHLGRKGVIVTESMKALIEQRTGALETIMAALSTNATKQWAWHELNEIEQLNLLDCIRLVNICEPIRLEDLSIVAFRAANLQGQYEDGHIRLARRILSHKKMCLLVLVHEVAHRAGGDGEKSHVAEIEKIWSAIVAASWKDQQ